MSQLCFYSQYCFLAWPWKTSIDVTWCVFKNRLQTVKIQKKGYILQLYQIFQCCDFSHCNSWVLDMECSLLLPYTAPTHPNFALSHKNLNISSHMYFSLYSIRSTLIFMALMILMFFWEKIFLGSRSSQCFRHENVKIGETW